MIKNIDRIHFCRIRHLLKMPALDGLWDSVTSVSNIPPQDFISIFWRLENILKYSLHPKTIFKFFPPVMT